MLASTATRVRATLDGVLPRISAPREVRWLRGLYLAESESLLAELNGLPDGVRTVLLCGHNPGLHQLALELLDDGGTVEALRAGLPTAGLVIVDVDDEWADIGVGSGRLVEFRAPLEEAG